MDEKTFTSRGKVKQLGERIINNAIKKSSKNEVVSKLIRAIEKVQKNKPIMLGGKMAKGQLSLALKGLKVLPAGRVISLALTLLSVKEVFDALSEDKTNN